MGLFENKGVRAKPADSKSLGEMLRGWGIRSKTDTALTGRNSATNNRAHDVNPRERRGRR